MLVEVTLTAVVVVRLARLRMEQGGHIVSCPKYGPFLDTLSMRGRLIAATPKRTMI